MLYMVEHEYYYGWDDACWTLHQGRDVKPWRFDTREEAQEEINALCRDMGYEPESYRVVEV